MSSSTISPVFVLKGINWSMVQDLYKSNHWKNYKPEKTSAKIEEIRKIFVPSYGNSTDSPIYTFKDKNNIPVVVYTTNHSNYEVYTEKGHLPEGGTCDWCRVAFSQIATGIPLAHNKVTRLVQNDTNFQLKSVDIFWVHGTFCSFECALAEIRVYTNHSTLETMGVYTTAEGLLKMLFMLTHPNKFLLRAAPYYKLLKSNGGSMDDAQFRSNNHKYIVTSNVVIAPAKIQFIEYPE